VWRGRGCVREREVWRKGEGGRGVALLLVKGRVVVVGERGFHRHRKKCIVWSKRRSVGGGEFLGGAKS